ncbi:MAG: protein kinase [Chloroflexi bacterium]|jgi:serine/threonine protein kinase|nr:protein kinase [Chloroflexota bacterium]
MPYKPGDVILNKYRIEELIGRGAFAEVYRAVHVDLKIVRALKVLRRDAPGVGSSLFDDFEQRFRLEMQLGARISHPNVIHVYDVERDADALILVMEYASGGSLRERIQQVRDGDDRFSVEDALKIVIEVATGLGKLHSLDAVHRDLKPSNILFDAEGVAKLADFGLAQIPGGPSMRSQLSQPIRHPGTAGYMSPEQEKSFNFLKPASDVYALGVILFELLTERNYHYIPPGTAASQLRDEVPAWLDELLARMLAINPTERPWDGGQVAQELQAGFDLLHTGNINSERLKQERIEQEAARKKKSQEEQARKQQKLEDHARKLAQKQKEQAERKAKRVETWQSWKIRISTFIQQQQKTRIRKSAERKKARSDKRSATSARLKPKIIAFIRRWWKICCAILVLAIFIILLGYQYESPGWPFKPTAMPTMTLRPTATHTVTSAFTQVPTKSPSITYTPTLALTLTPTSTYFLSSTPGTDITSSPIPLNQVTPVGGGSGFIGVDSCKVLSIGTNYSCLPICKINLIDGEQSCILESLDDEIRHIAWSPNGSQIAYSTDNATYIMEFDGQDHKQLLDTGGELAWSPDGSLIVSAGIFSKGEITVIQIDGTIRYEGWWPSIAGKGDLQWSPDSRRISFRQGSNDGNAGAWLMNPDGSDIVRVFDEGHYNYINSWSPDSTQMALVYGVYDWDEFVPDQEIYIVSADRLRSKRLTYHKGIDMSPEFSPDGTKIVYVSYRFGDPEIYVVNSDGSGQTQLTDNPGEDQSPTWSPDGTKIAFYSERDGIHGIYLMNIDGSEVTFLTSGRTPVWFP